MLKYYSGNIPQKIYKLMEISMKRKEVIINCIFLFIAGIINAVGVALILVPAHVIDSGFSGTSILLSEISKLPLSAYLLILNLPMFFIGFKKLGLHFIIYSCIAIISYSATSFLFQQVFGLGDKVFNLIKGDLFLASVFGGMISGIGSGLTIRFGGALDGIEALAILVAKKIGLSVGQFIMVYNCIIYTATVIIFKDLAIGLYSVVSYAVGLKIVDFIVDGFDKGKAFMIITDKPKIVAQEISEKMNRGITVINSKGYYSDSDKTILYCVVNRFEAVKLKKILQAVDVNAFIAINDISEVVGDKVKLKLNLKNGGVKMPRSKNEINQPIVACDQIDNLVDQNQENKVE